MLEGQFHQAAIGQFRSDHGIGVGEQGIATQGDLAGQG
jgi:hypothetical protein